MTYIIGIVAFAYMVQKGCIDIKMFTRAATQVDIRKRFWYLLTDWVYLVGIAVTMFALAYTSWYAGHIGMSLWVYSQALLIGLLLGDEVWDLGFGYVVDGDAFFPFPNWVFGWGFANKSERITFDACRVGLAILLVVV